MPYGTKLEPKACKIRTRDEAEYLTPFASSVIALETLVELIRCRFIVVAQRVALILLHGEPITVISRIATQTLQLFQVPLGSAG